MDAVGASWAFWLVALSGLHAALWCVGAVIAWRRAPLALWRVLGDVLGVVVLFGSAVRSANAQRFHPNLNLFLGAAFAVAFFLHVRPKVFLSAMLASTALVLSGILTYRGASVMRTADLLALLGISSPSPRSGLRPARQLRRARRLSSPPDAVLRERVSAIPAALVAEIAAAVHIADYDALLGVVSRLPPEDAPVAAALRALTEEYRYDDIAAALAIVS